MHYSYSQKSEQAETNDMLHIRKKKRRKKRRKKPFAFAHETFLEQQQNH